MLWSWHAGGDVARCGWAVVDSPIGESMCRRSQLNWHVS